MKPRRDLLPALTPLRFPAAFAAVLFHVWGLLLGPNGRIPPTVADERRFLGRYIRFPHQFIRGRILRQRTLPQQINL